MGDSVFSRPLVVVFTTRSWSQWFTSARHSTTKASGRQVVATMEDLLTKHSAPSSSSEHHALLVLPSIPRQPWLWRDRGLKCGTGLSVPILLVATRFICPPQGSSHFCQESVNRLFLQDFGSTAQKAQNVPRPLDRSQRCTADFKKTVYI